MRAETLANDPAPRVDEALRGLDEGMARLGPLVTLQMYAIDLEAQHARYDAALTRLDRMTAAAARKETLLARRAEILAKGRCRGRGPAGR